MLLRILASLLALLLPACALLGFAPDGSGRAATEERTLEPFRAVRLDFPAEVFVTRAEARRVAVTCDDNLLRLVRTRVRDGWLVLDLAEDAAFRVPPEIHLQLPDLEGFRVHGRGRADIRGLAGERFEGSVKDGGRLAASGTVDRLEASVVGRGRIDLGRLEAREARVDLEGAGEVDLSVSEVLRYRIDGDGDVRYRGNPRVTGGVLGGGSVRPVDPAVGAVR